jgi:hypothetical protein
MCLTASFFFTDWFTSKFRTIHPQRRFHGTNFGGLPWHGSLFENFFFFFFNCVAETRKKFQEAKWRRQTWAGLRWQVPDQQLPGGQILAVKVTEPYFSTNLLTLWCCLWKLLPSMWAFVITSINNYLRKLLFSNTPYSIARHPHPRIGNHGVGNPIFFVSVGHTCYPFSYRIKCQFPCVLS